MNVAEIIKLKYKKVSGEHLSFERAKTELICRGRDAIVITCHLNDDMLQTIEKWDKKDKSPDNFIFPIVSQGVEPFRMIFIGIHLPAP